MHKRFFLIFLLFPIFVSAQISSIVSYEQAVALALKNNFDIQLAKSDATVATIENSYGNAGFLPKVDLNANASLSNNKTRQEFSSGLIVDKSGVASSNVNSGVFLTWTIFDGMKMFASKERLNILEQEGELRFKIQLENTIEQVTLLYYQIVKQEQLIKGINASKSVSEERIKIAKKKSELGSGSNVELLQAKLDLNAQKSNLIVQKNLLNEFKNNLLLLLKSSTNESFAVDSIFIFEPLKSMDEIKQKIEKSNYSILFAQKNALLSKQTIKELQSQALPKLNLTSNYLFGRSENAAGFALLNQNLGCNVGLGFSWNLFNGLNTYNQIKVAKIQGENNSLTVENIKFTLFSAANIAYIHWLGNKELVELEEENIKLAEQSLNITMERLKLGLGNYLEIKEGQSSYETSLNRLVNARYNLKQSETALKKITGDLLR